MGTMAQTPLHIEVAIPSICPTPRSQIRSRWQAFLKNLESPSGLVLSKNSCHLDLSKIPVELRDSCIRAVVTLEDERTDAFLDLAKEGSLIPAHRTRDAVVHVFHLSQEEASIEELEAEGGDDEWTAGCDSLPLPHADLDGLWENLVFESKVKGNLLQYAQTALLFSDKAVSSHIVHWNRILLLHGPPGTGKTSLCRCLAHKLAIRLEDRFPRATLLDVRAHSLFSKWFSTSGKLVSTLFQMVRDMVQDDPLTLVCLLVDEVESLASSRSNPSSGDPSDAMRAVNSLLTSLDRLRSFPNVLVLATTNLTDAVDEAFVDRVDLKVHIGLPILKARYQILKSCLEELLRVGIILPPETKAALPPFRQVQGSEINSSEGAIRLLECAKRSEGLSGRSLRRLPLQAHAQFLRGAATVSLHTFLKALQSAIEEEQSSRNDMTVA